MLTFLSLKLTEFGFVRCHFVLKCVVGLIYFNLNLFRNHRLPCWLYNSSLQSTEKQAAAPDQPEQEDHHFSWLVSSDILHDDIEHIDDNDSDTLAAVLSYILQCLGQSQKSYKLYQSCQ